MSRVIFLALAIFLSGPSVATVTYLHTDIFGNLIAETDENRNVVRRYSYEPYGLPRQPIDGPGFTGHNMDDDSALIYMQQRYYDPEIGRFLSIDPMGLDTANAWNFNRYNYAANNPVSNSDPNGAVCVAMINMQSAMCQRSIRYHAEHGDPRISGRTSFYGAAAMMTSAMALPEQGSFMESLSATLESKNTIRAQMIREGRLYAGGSVIGNDVDYIHYEQSVVQNHLDGLRTNNPALYQQVIADANDQLNSLSTTVFGRATDPNVARALGIARERIGGDINFANQEHREILGRAASEVARGSQQLCAGSHLRRC